MDEKKSLFGNSSSRFNQALNSIKGRFSSNSMTVGNLWDMAEALNDSQLRQTIAKNPNAPLDILQSALKDDSWEVRRNAIMNPSTWKEDCMERAKVEDHPQVLDALRTRLGDSFQFVTPDEHFDHEIKEALDYSAESTDLPQNWQDRKPSLEFIANAAAMRSAAQPVQDHTKIQSRESTIEH